MPLLDILQLLPPLSWRGIEVPCQANSVTFEQGIVEHRQHGIDGAHVESVGRGSARMSFTIPFRVGIIEYHDLYPKRFRDFWDACLDGSTGPLKHPEFGELDAKCASFALDVNPERRDGYDVRVEFVETTESELTIADNPVGPIDFAISIADSMGKKYSIAVPDYDDGSGTDLLQALKQLKGFVSLLQMTVQGVLTRIDSMIDAVNGMIDAVNQATSVEAWGVIDSLKAIIASLYEVKGSIAPEHKRVEFIVAPKNMTVRDAAAAAKMELRDFFGMNPKFARVKEIKLGEEYFVQVK